MINIPKKNLSQVPDSIKLPTGATDETKAKTTHKRRQEAIQAKNFPKGNSKFTSRYKDKDLKNELSKQSHYKCVYCEQYSERWDVEHYRPTSEYYWLAYSWDNLLYACPTCNQNYKKDKFDILGSKVEYDPSDLAKIHELCEDYNKKEEAMLLHSEYDDLDNMWEFNKNGEIFSSNIRGEYTIKICGLSRDKLNDRRKQIIDDFGRDLNEIKLSSKTDTEFEIALSVLINQFTRNSKDVKRNFWLLEYMSLQIYSPH